ncbi:MAG: glycerol-3-phosphate acyltransferase [Actinobacteria bacterium]|nr:glycerol-3-phosphate acyltransferase [Actinomycetota bacterium]
MEMEYVLSTAVAYIIGSIPFAYLAGKVKGGKNLLRVGTGNLGTHNVFHEVGKPVGVLVFFLDCAKAGLTLLVYWLMGVSLWGLSLAALAVLAGHNWSVFTRFKGGRGIAVFLVGSGILLPVETLVMLAVFAFGVFTKTVALSCGIAVLVLPLFSLVLAEPAPLVFFAFCAAAMVFIRRLQGSPDIQVAGREKISMRDVVLYRLILDREASHPWSERHR